MEHRGDLNRQPEPAARVKTGPPDSSVLRQHSDARQRHVVPDHGRLPRFAQHPGGSAERNGTGADSQPTAPVLYSTDERDAAGANELASLDGRPTYRDIFDGQSAAVVLLDHNLIIRELNPAAENLLGVSRLRARGKPFLLIVDNDKTFAEILEQSLTSGITYAYEATLANKHAKSDAKTVECRVSALTDLEGSKTLLVEMIDITRRLRISRENALLIQHGAGRQMVRQLAHEIKNPLGGLRGAAQLLGRQLSSAELREYTEVIISEADRLVALVDTLLGPGGPPNKQPTNVHELLEYVMRLLAPELTDRIGVKRYYDPGLPDVDLDRDQIVQAIINLVRNAAAALEGSGKIVLRTSAEMNFTIGDKRYPVVANIEIEDDGPGIPADLQGSVFYPLVTSRAEGTGLGLPAAQELVSRHGGLIEFESRPGRTVFFIRLPLNTDRALSR